MGENYGNRVVSNSMLRNQKSLLHPCKHFFTISRTFDTANYQVNLPTLFITNLTFQKINCL